MENPCSIIPSSMRFFRYTLILSASVQYLGAVSKKSAQELSAYIHALHLMAEQNNGLIALIIERVQDAERGAFAAGRRTWHTSGQFSTMRTGSANALFSTLPESDQPR